MRALCALLLICLWPTVAIASIAPIAPIASAAPTADHPTLAALKRLNRTPKYVDQHRKEMARSAALVNYCQSFDQGCVDYIADNREAVIAELPDSPAYWQAYLDFIASAPIPFEHAQFFKASKPGDDYELGLPLIHAARDWAIYEVAHTGNLDAAEVLGIARGARHRLMHSETLLERMIFVAITPFVQASVGFAMRQEAASGNTEMLESLYQATRPLQPAELSLAAIAERELDPTKFVDPPQSEVEWAAWVSTVFADFPEQEAIQLARVPTPEAFSAMPENFRQVRLAMNLTIESVRLTGAQTLEAYWDSEQLVPSGWDTLTAQLGAEEMSHWVLLYVPEFSDYIRNSMQLALNQQVLHALADVYSGRTSLGVPARPPLNNFVWGWRNSEQKLCLTPIDGARGGAMEVCGTPFSAL